jgi:hypothetical protein
MVYLFYICDLDGEQQTSNEAFGSAVSNTKTENEQVKPTKPKGPMCKKDFVVQLNVVAPFTTLWGQCYKTFCGQKLRILVIS